MTGIAIGVAASFAALVILLTQAWRHLRTERRENETLRKAYAELMSGSSQREAALLVRSLAAEEDADRLAPAVAQYLKDIDDTAALLKDKTPPAMTAERDALRLHHEALKHRSNHDAKSPKETRTQRHAHE